MAPTSSANHLSYPTEMTATALAVQQRRLNGHCVGARMTSAGSMRNQQSKLPNSFSMPSMSSIQVAGVQTTFSPSSGPEKRGAVATLASRVLVVPPATVPGEPGRHESSMACWRQFIFCLLANQVTEHFAKK